MRCSGVGTSEAISRYLCCVGRRRVCFSPMPYISKRLDTTWHKRTACPPGIRFGFDLLWDRCTAHTHTGDVVYHQVESATVLATHALDTAVCERYPHAKHIYMGQDNRPIHLHVRLLEALLPQRSSFNKPLLPSWEKGSTKIGKLPQLPIEIGQLPTYAPWTNPIEKLWRWVRQIFR